MALPSELTQIKSLIPVRSHALGNSDTVDSVMADLDSGKLTADEAIEEIDNLDKNEPVWKRLILELMLP